jgi:hypothetical protein
MPIRGSLFRVYSSPENKSQSVAVLSMWDVRTWKQNANPWLLFRITPSPEK